MPTSPALGRLSTRPRSVEFIEAVCMTITAAACCTGGSCWYASRKPVQPGHRHIEQDQHGAGRASPGGKLLECYQGFGSVAGRQVFVGHVQFFQQPFVEGVGCGIVVHQQPRRNLFHTCRKPKEVPESNEAGYWQKLNGAGMFGPGPAATKKSRLPALAGFRPSVRAWAS